ncbi:MAG TPA: hypothetical protein PKD48_13700 [Sphingopyxis sp.]|nr:hypothetical protein [Sphingopyxis sp.]
MNLGVVAPVTIFDTTKAGAQLEEISEMLKSRFRFGICALSCLCVSCIPVEHELCKEDKFYCGLNWESDVEELDFNELISVTESYYKVRGVGHKRLLQEISNRDKAIETIISRSESGKKILYIDFMEMIVYLTDDDRKKICSPDTRDKLIKSFINSGMSSESFRAACSQF